MMTTLQSPSKAAEPARVRPSDGNRSPGMLANERLPRGPSALLLSFDGCLVSERSEMAASERAMVPRSDPMPCAEAAVATRVVMARTPSILLTVFMSFLLRHPTQQPTQQGDVVSHSPFCNDPDTPLFLVLFGARHGRREPPCRTLLARHIMVSTRN